MLVKNLQKFYILLIVSAFFASGCSEKKQALPLTSIRPTVMEATSVLLEYHNREIQKYSEAVLREQAGIIRLLNEHRMREVRQAYTRKQLYVRKIKEHQKALKEIKGMQDEAHS